MRIMVRAVVTASLALALSWNGLPVLSGNNEGLAPQAGIAMAAAKTKLTFGKVNKVLETSCGSYTITHISPKLTGSTKKNRDTVTAAFNAALKTATASEIADYERNVYMDGCFKPKFRVQASGTIYKGRYLSVVISWKGDWYSASMDDVRTLNLDLKTGKTVSLSTFAHDKNNALFGMYAWKAVAKKLCKGCGVDPDTFPREFKKFSRWTVSKSGITVYTTISTYAQDQIGTDWGVYSAIIPWSNIVKPSFSKAKKHNTKKVKSYYSCGLPTYDGNRVTVTVQGNRVAVKHNRSVYYGVKSRGVKRGGKWRVDVFNAPWAYDGQGYVEFLSKSSNKATSFVYQAICE
jgi:hypothetical protein